MTVSEEHGYADRTRTELIDEIIDLTNRLRTKNVEITDLKKKLAVYKSL